MTTNNFNEKGYYTERVSKILRLKPYQIALYMADRMVEEWERIRLAIPSIPELDFGEERGINDIPKDNIILKLKTPRGGLVINYFEGEDGKEDTWELRSAINHAAKARILTDKVEIFKNSFPISTLFWGKPLSALFLKRNNIQKEFSDIYDLFYSIVQYRQFLFRKYTSKLMRLFDCNEVFYNKENKAFLARRREKGRKEIVIEGLTSIIGNTGIPAYKIRVEDEELYHPLMVSTSIGKYLEVNWRTFTSAKEAALYLISFNRKFIRECDGEIETHPLFNDMCETFRILVSEGLKDNNVFTESFKEEYPHIEKTLLMFVNELYDKCNPYGISAENINDYINNYNEIRRKINKLLDNLLFGIRGLLYNVKTSSVASHINYRIESNGKFDIDSLEKNSLMIYSISPYADDKESYETEYLDKIYIEDNKNIAVLANYAFALFYLANNVTLNMDYEILNKVSIHIKKGEKMTKTTLLKKLDDIMNNKTNLLTKYKEEEKESTVGNY